MSRPRRAPSSPVQLFPFLAVLVSTMGALILLLLAINRQVTLQAIAEAFRRFVQQASTEEESLTVQRHELEQRVVTLRGQISELQRDRSSVDQSFLAAERRVRMEVARADSLSQELDRIRAERVQTEQEIRSVRDQIGAVEAKLQRRTAERRNADRTFVPVVHPGANGTTRQPIYIECMADSLIFQPGLFELPLATFYEDEGAADAFARVIGALARHYRALDAENGLARTTPEPEPYPLFLVRPTGIRADALARNALQETEFSFGYELIEADWTLQFPDTDPQARALAEAAWRGKSSGRLEAGEAGVARTHRTSGMGAPTAVVKRGGLANAEESSLTDRLRSVDKADVATWQRLGFAPQATAGGSSPRRTERAGSRQQITDEKTERSPSLPRAEPDRDVPRQELSRSVVAKKASAQPVASGEPERSASGGARGLGGAVANSRITARRRIEVECARDRLVVGSRALHIPLPGDSLADVIEQLSAEIDHEVASWGPPGITYRWQPQLVCRVHGGAIDNYYRLRLALAGSELLANHVVVIDDEWGLEDSGLPKRSPGSALNIGPIWSESIVAACIDE